MKKSIPPAAALAGMAALLAAALLLSLRCGSQNYTMLQLLAAAPDSAAGRILRHVRLPRTAAGLLAGAALAVAGALLQTVLNNAMASPNVIGVNAGAGFFVLLAALWLPAAPGVQPAAAFAGALCAALLIYGLAAGMGLSRTTLVLAGVTVSSILTAGVDAVCLLDPDLAVSANAFRLGGFSGVTLAAVGRAAPYLLAGLLLALLLAPDLNVLRLGEESAAALGLAVGRTRFLTILAAALLAGAAVSFAGLLGFVGLLVPHIVRRFLGGDLRWLLPGCALLGGAFVLGCDVLARMLFAPFELPVGIVMSLLGGPFFLHLLLRSRRRHV